jgi:succinoglycan biosynthesis protein ExoM
MQLVGHITVCICTYKRANLLPHLLSELELQDTNGLFTFSIVVVDNDAAKSAEKVIAEFASTSKIRTSYHVEPNQNIALARNKAVQNAEGNFVCFIDDDEFPGRDWLLTLFTAYTRYGVDGVLGPVKPHFDEGSPRWVIKGKFYERLTYNTGHLISGSEGRTGNVLLKRELFSVRESPFRPEFRSGEDQDFFTRMIGKGYRFVWCNEAVAYEVVPPSRWKRTFMLRRALLRGAMQPNKGDFGVASVGKSILAVPIYFTALPFCFLVGQPRGMAILVRLCDHLGKLLALLGLNPVRDMYVIE